MALLSRLPYVGEGWYAKPACAYMLESGVATWQDFLWSLDATAHVEPSCLAWALRRMEEAWGEEEHLAKLSVNALIGLWARNVDLLYLMRTSNNQLDGNGCQYRQTFVDSKGGTYWDHVYVAQLFSNASHRPAWDFVMAAEYCAVASVRQQLAEVPTRFFKCIKTDCLVLQGLPKKYWPAVERLTRGRHPDGTAVYRCEQVEPRLGEGGGSRGPLLEGEEPAADGPARDRQDTPGQAHRDAASGGWGPGAAGQQDPLRRTEPGLGGPDGGPLGAADGAQRQVQA